MRSPRIVEGEVPADSSARRRDGLVAMQVHLFVLHGLPQPFDEHIVTPAALAIHADTDAVFLEQSGERCAGELAAPIGVEERRPAITSIAFSTASMQKSVSIEIDTRQDNTRREYQSMTTAR